MKSVMPRLSMAMLATVLTASAAFSSATGSSTTGSYLGDQVRRQLNKLPFITVFDRMDYEITGDTVRLTGAVTRPWLKSGAEAVVKKIEGVSTVINQIEVLPLSRFDDQIRGATYRALFHRNSPLHRYNVGSNGSIRIIVSNGHVTLEGFVTSKMDSQLAEMAARQVPGTFSITNHLKIG